VWSEKEWGVGSGGVQSNTKCKRAWSTEGCGVQNVNKQKRKRERERGREEGCERREEKRKGER
jgi:hypothetical protein